MATDYDVRRASDDDEDVDSIEALRGNVTAQRRSPVLDTDEPVEEDLELPGADLSGEELVVTVVPRRPDEFTCPSCFLLLHKSRRTASGRCIDCD